MARFYRLAPAILGLLILLPGCTMVQQLAALRQVDFNLNRADEAFLAGVDIDRIRNYSDLSIIDATRLLGAVSSGSLPLQFNLHLDATNPGSNSAAAQLVQLDWTLFIDDTETVSGIFNDNRLIQPGTTADIPISMEVDLVRFLGSNARDIVDLALNLAGAGGNPARLSLRARPTINTAIGPISYPGDITISHTVGR